VRDKRSIASLVSPRSVLRITATPVVERFMGKYGQRAEAQRHAHTALRYCQLQGRMPSMIRILGSKEEN